MKKKSYLHKDYTLIKRFIISCTRNENKKRTRNLEQSFLNTQSYQNIVLRAKIQNGLKIGENSVSKTYLFKLCLLSQEQRKHHDQLTVWSQNESMPILFQSSLSGA